MGTYLEQAIAVAGGQSALARAIGVAQQNVHGWLRKSGGRVPAEHVLAIERATGVSRHDLRPDVFGPASTGRAA